MLEPSTIKQEYFKSICPEVKKICEPIFDLLPIKMFRYVQADKDGKKIVLCSEETWIEEYFKKKFYNIEFANYSKFPEAAEGISMHALFEVDNPFSQFWNPVGETLGFNQLFTTYRKNNQFLEGYDFAFYSQTGVTNSLLNNIEFVRKFALYFEEQSLELLKRSKRYHIYYDMPKNFDFTDNWILGVVSSEADWFLKKISPSKIFIDEKRQVFLTLNESKCLKMIVEGKKYKEIAISLGLALRTVDDLVAKTKNKLQAASKSDLILKTVNSNLYNKIKLIDT